MATATLYGGASAVEDYTLGEMMCVKVKDLPKKGKRKLEEKVVLTVPRMQVAKRVEVKKGDVNNSTLGVVYTIKHPLAGVYYEYVDADGRLGMRRSLCSIIEKAKLINRMKKALLQEVN